MADASAKKIHDTRPNAGRQSYQIADGVTVYEGMLTQLQSGFVNHWDETGKFLGTIVNGDHTLVSGDFVLLGATSDTPPPEATVDESGVILMHLASMAGTPTQAKVGDLVYSADSDTDSLTMTDTTNPPVGVLVRFRSATDLDVRLFTPGEFDAGIASGTWLV